MTLPGRTPHLWPDRTELVGHHHVPLKDAGMPVGEEVGEPAEIGDPGWIGQRDEQAEIGVMVRHYRVAGLATTS